MWQLLMYGNISCICQFRNGYSKGTTSVQLGVFIIIKDHGSLPCIIQSLTQLCASDLCRTQTCVQQTSHICRGITSLTVLNQQEFHFSHIPKKSIVFSYIFSNPPHFCPHSGPRDGRVVHLERPWQCHLTNIIFGTLKDESLFSFKLSTKQLFQLQKIIPKYC